LLEEGLLHFFQGRALEPEMTNISNTGWAGGRFMASQAGVNDKLLPQKCRLKFTEGDFSPWQGPKEISTDDQL
jgi:hypothetical protein